MKAMLATETEGSVSNMLTELPENVQQGIGGVGVDIA